MTRAEWKRRAGVAAKHVEEITDRCETLVDDIAGANPYAIDAGTAQKPLIEHALHIQRVAGDLVRALGGAPGNCGTVTRERLHVRWR